MVVFCDEVKGKSALALARDLDIQYKTTFVLDTAFSLGFLADGLGVADHTAH